jgi:hypothetical protein
MFPTTSLADLIPEADFIQNARGYAKRHLTKMPFRTCGQGDQGKRSVMRLQETSWRLLSASISHGRHLSPQDLGLASVCLWLHRRKGRQVGAMPALASSLSQAGERREDGVRPLDEMVVAKFPIEGKHYEDKHRCRPSIT